MTMSVWPHFSGPSEFDAFDPSTWDVLPAGYEWQQRESAGEFHLIAADGTDLSVGFRQYRAVCPEACELTALLSLPAVCRTGLGYVSEFVAEDEGL